MPKEDAKKPEKIIGAKKVNDAIFFLVKFGREYVLMRSEEANLDLPNLVVEFYIQRLVYTTASCVDTFGLTGWIEPLNPQEIAEVVGELSKFLVKYFIIFINIRFDSF